MSSRKICQCFASRIGFLKVREWFAQLLILLLLCGLIPVRVRADEPLPNDDEYNQQMRDLYEKKVRYEEQLWMDERIADMRAAWDALDEMRAAAERSYLSSIPRPPIVGPRFSSNAFGATYDVPHGSYSGDGLVGLQEVDRSDNPNSTPVAIQRSITRGQPGLRHLSGGWTFEPGGMLKETYSVVAADVIQAAGGSVTQCKVADRFQYVKPNGGGGIEFLEKGIEDTCDFTLQSQSPDACASSAPGFCNASRPAEFLSTSGQVLLDVTNITTPVIIYPDGSQESLKTRATSAYLPFNEGLFDSVGSSVLINGTWFTDKHFTKNGYITRFTYDPNTGWVQSVTDAKNRVTQYTRDGNGRVLTITVPGVGGVSRRWQMTWNTFTWNPAATFPDVQCLGGENFVVPCTNSLSYTTLTNLLLPDGRSYSFSYSPPGSSTPGWGNLYTVSTPDGAVNAFDYGNASTVWVSAPRQGNVPSYTDKLDKRHLASNTVYPQGAGGPALTTRMDFEQTETLTNDVNAMCGQVNWIKRTYPDGNFMREAQCAFNRTDFPSLYGRTFAQELWQGAVRIQGTYYGNTGQLGDNSTPRGNLYVEYEEANTPNGANIDLDVRPTKVIYKRDGVQWTERYEYEVSTVPVTPRCSGCSSLRTTGNVANLDLLDAAGTVLTSTMTSYWATSHPNYKNRNLIRLPEIVRVKDGAGLVLARTDYAYDQFGYLASGATNLDTSIGVRRGDETSVTKYKDPQIGGGAVTTQQRFYDTGDVQQKIDGRNNATTFEYDFAPCGSTHLTLFDRVRNIKNHTTTTIKDCFTGAVLRTTDPNGASSYNQYDDQGRLVETAVPGDKLSSLSVAVFGSTPVPGAPAYVRDSSAPLSGSPSVGSGGNGPTTWTEYFSTGVINQQRMVEHTKDGSPDGRYTKTFVDGLARMIQTRAEVDPSVSSNNSEAVESIEYDAVGRVSRKYVPVFASAANSYIAPAAGSLAVVTQYDAAGRVTSVQQPGLPAVRTAFAGSGTLFQATTTDAKGNQTIAYTDLLGRKVREQQQSSRCTDPIAAGWCVTQYSYDAAGRLLSITDPNWNVTSFTYDGLGLRKQMTDPDMGTWFYDYDNNGNMTFQRDAKGQVINMSYDELNRLKLKDLPGPDDTTYFYDGEIAP